MGKEIGRISKHGQSQLSTFSPKTPVSSSYYHQTSSDIELTTMYVPSVRDKHQNNSVFIPKIPSRMMPPSQTMMTYSLVINPKNKIISLQPFQHPIIIFNVLLPHNKVY